MLKSNRYTLTEKQLTKKQIIDQLVNNMPIFVGETKDEIAYRKIKIIIAFLNEGWKPDFANNNQQKWYNWFRFDASRGCFVIYVALSTYEYAVTFVGAQFCFKTKTKAQYFGENYIEIINDYYLN